uniref:(California timema) hypothetical protein n=1 Tax=Timema californicum TaxID=61474 RepID=A0A7R9IX68_TIMCA|nr:unnamed protein product [Timema californicum]
MVKKTDNSIGRKRRNLKDVQSIAVGNDLYTVVFQIDINTLLSKDQSMTLKFVVCLISVIQMSGFRSLGDEEEVEFECKNSDKGLESTLVTGLDGADCCGSHRRPTSKKRFRKIRCYNCGEFANHIAAKCTMGPQPKRCHNCKSQDHLIADCPTRLDRKKPSLISIVNELEHEDNGTGGNVDSTMPGQD